MKRLNVLLAFLFVMGMFVVHAQTTMSGTVTDANGDPIPGANIRAKGYSDVGTISDLNGGYTLSVPEEATALVFSFVGMQTQTVEIGELTTINVNLQNEDVGIDEIVVTALGIKRDKKKLGYSVSTVDNEELNRGTSTNFTKALAGKVAGVKVSGGIGAPGSSTNVTLRGYSTIGRGTQPLYVIDGNPVSNMAQSYSDGGGDVNRSVDFGNGINDINALDIESMSILRGAAATALYGSQASNGVIMITTKSGSKNNKPKISFNSSSVFSSVLKYPDYQSQFGQGWDGNYASEENGSWGPEFSNEDQLWGYEINGQQLVKKNSFLEDQVRDFYDIGKMFDNSISLSGGGEVATYYASYNYVTSDGVVPGDKDGLDKHSFKLNSSMKMGKVTASAGVNYINNRTSSLITGQARGGNENLFDVVLGFPTDISMVDMGHDYKDPQSFYHANNFFSPYLMNPYFTIDNSENIATTDRFIGTASLMVDLVEAYRFKGTFRMGGDVSNTFGHSYDKKFTLGDDSPNKGTHQDIPGYYKEFQSNAQQYNIDVIFTAGKDLMGGELIIDGTLGYNMFHRATNFSAESVTGLVFEQAYPNLANSTAIPAVNGTKTTRRLQGLYGSVEMGFKSYLFLQLTARNDWSSTLPVENNSYFYPSANLGLILTEAISALGDLSFLDYMKVRVGYGFSGKDAPVYRVDPVYAQGAVTGGIPFSDLTFPLAGVTGYEYGNVLGNPNLVPEISSEFETGIDLRFFQNRFGVDLTYYNKVTDGMILLRTVASTSGFTSQVDNIGEMSNEGVELTVNLTPIKTNDLRWDISYMFSKNNNEVLSLVDGLDEVYIAGFTSPYVAAIAGKTSSQIKAVGMQYTDDGRVIVDANTGRPLDSQNDEDLGTTLHDYTMGLSSNLSYKNFELSILFDYRKGGQFISYSKGTSRWGGKDPITTYNDRKPFVVPNSVYLADDGTFVENQNPITKVDLNNYYAGGWNDQAIVLDKTFLKLRELSLTYRIPAKVFGNTFIESASISLIGNNLFLWTPVENNMVDPEVTTTGNDAAAEFGEIRGYPSVRSYGFKLNINL